MKARMGKPVHSVNTETWKRETRISVTAGNWPYDPGADAEIIGIGTHKRRPDASERVWSVVWDESPDPHKAAYRRYDYLKYAEASRCARQVVASLGKHREKETPNAR